MKKAKNEASANKPSTISSEKISANDPSEKIRSKENGNGELSFKKVLYGYDPNEVVSYIEELRNTYEASARTHDVKLSSLKEELALSNRERDSYSKKYKECKANLDKLPEKTAVNEAEKNNDAAEEYKAEIARLKTAIERTEAENERLREKNSQSNAAVSAEYAERISILEKENAEAKATAEAVQRRNEELVAAEQKYEALFADYNSLTAQNEHLKAEKDLKEKEVMQLKEELVQKSDELKKLSAEKDESKKKLAESEAENGVLHQRTEENEKEILRLKETNKTQAHEYAEKINELESEQAAVKLAMQKEIKLRDYYINQAQSTLLELSEQMEQIKKTFTDSI